MSRPEANLDWKRPAGIEDHAAYNRLFQPGRLTFGVRTCGVGWLLAGRD